MGRLFRKLRSGGAVLALGISLIGSVSAQQANTPDPPQPASVPAHLAKAKQIAGSNPFLQYIATQGYWCMPPAAGVKLRTSQSKDAAQPVQLFDNLYMMGTGFVDTMVLKTSAGLIVWDTLDNEQEERTIFEPAMKRFGLDPHDIKLVILTHGHADHYGGAKYLQDTYHVPIALSAADWDLIANTPMRPNSPQPPRRDQILTDRQKITIGDTTVQIVLTPGHTPATVSSIFPVKDKGQVRIMAAWGGTAYPATKAALDQMGASMEKFKAAAKAANAVGLLNTHAFFFDITNRASGRDLNGPNPLVIGSENVQKTVDIMHECLKSMDDWYTAMGKS